MEHTYFAFANVEMTIYMHKMDMWFIAPAAKGNR